MTIITPHLTPQKLLGKRPLPPHWQAAQTAFICFTPFPNGFKPYVVEAASERYFIHSPNSEVRLCRFQDIPFLVISEVYGFAVGATTVEELVHYGLRQIIGIGYAGAFSGAEMGQRFVAAGTMADLPLAAHYGVDAYDVCEPRGRLVEVMEECVERDTAVWGQYTVWNGNSLYREYSETVAQMREKGCEVVNMDTLSLYAVAPVCAREVQEEVSCIYVGTVTDAAEGETADWQSDLLQAVDRQQAHPHDALITFIVEVVLPAIMQDSTNG